MLFDNTGWPTAENPNFWSIVSERIAKELPLYAGAVKLWPLVYRIPFWYPNITPLEVNYLIGVQDHYRYAISESEQERFRKGLTEPMLGHTEDSYAQTVFDFGIDDIKTSAQAIRMAHEVIKIEQGLKPITYYEHIVEIGGGIGELARFCVDYGFTGRYTILDLAPVLDIQRAYLDGAYPGRFNYASDVSDIPKLGTTLVIGTWSLSEIAFVERARICAALAGAEWFVIFQNLVFGMSNTEWFVRHFKGLTKCNAVRFENMTFHQFQGGAFYLYGRDQDQAL
jgi:hypothetical protein